MIVDVFRAFTTASLALDRGVSKIFFVSEPDDALALRERGVADFCVGEVDGIPPDGFDFGNSPYELARADIAGKVMVQSTRAGAVGVNAARYADALYGVALTNAKATVDAILASKPETVTIVAMGLRGLTRTDEDELCAMYLRNMLEGREPSAGAVSQLIRASKEAVKFMDPQQPYFHPEDVEYALRVNTIDRVLRIHKEEGLPVYAAS